MRFDAHAHGFTLDLPPGWEARARRQPRSRGDRAGNLLLHASTRPLPAERGDFGSGAVDTLTAEDVFVSLFEYEPEDADETLFAARGLPRIRPSDFSPANMQRTLPGQSGAQWFFRVGDRAFCLFVVLGSHSRRAVLAQRANALVARMAISRRLS